MYNLFTKRNFGPFFIAMSMEAFNDNLFKSALVILIAYSLPKEQADLLVQLCGGIFILPFFIFSGITGQICDKYDKSTIIKFVKTFEVIIMATASFGFFGHNIPLLMTALFLMGIHSTVFGPAKYSILPQHLEAKNLILGNSLVSMGTFLAILFGTVSAGYLVSSDVIEKFSMFPISIAIISIALIGLTGSLFIPKATPSAPNIKIRLNPFVETIRTIKISKTKQVLFYSILGISWFWFYGFFFLASLPSYCRDALGGDERVASVLLTFISIGMGLGSILVNKFKNGRLELGVLHYAGIGLSLFALDLAFIGKTAPSDLTTYLTPALVFQNSMNYRVMFDLFMIGLSGGAFIVPLYVLLQEESPKEIASQVIASNNIINALFMVSAAIFGAILFKLGLNILTIFTIVALINMSVILVLILKMPREFFKMLVNGFVRIAYNFSAEGQEHIPANGPVILVANHASFIDPFVIAAGLPRTPCYVMDKDFHEIPILKQLLNIAKVIPITPKKIDPEAMKHGMETMIKRLQDGEVVALFPEAFISRDGEMIPFKTGIERILEQIDVPVIPIGVYGLWGSWFSRSHGNALKGFPFRKFRGRVGIRIGKPLRRPEATAEKLFHEVKKLRNEHF